MVKQIIQGDGHNIQIHQNIWTTNSKIQIKGKNCTLIIEEGVKLKNTTISLNGENSMVFIGQNVEVFSGLNIAANEGGGIKIGKNTSIGRMTITAATHQVNIGEDCMVSYNVEMRTTDSHPIFDITTKKRLNPNADISIGNYVWLGKDIKILKNVHIHQGAIIGTNSVVTKNIPAYSCAVGIPARVVQKNVIWTKRTRDNILETDGVAKKYLESSADFIQDKTNKKKWFGLKYFFNFIPWTK